MPLLYRSVLDLSYDLERLGDRQEAARIRGQATAAYSAAWNERQARRLRGLGQTAHRAVNARRSRLVG
jgi:hypothetical protein